MANIKQFGEYTTPTGSKGNIFSISNWAQLIIGVMVFLVAFAMGQSLTARVGSMLPIDTTIDSVVKQPQVGGKEYV